MARFRASLVASAFLSATALSGQQPVKVAQPVAPSAAPATHAVKRGDTLWGIAKQYLGDAYLWPEIYRLNTAVVEDPHWIYPGETLRLPAGTVAAAGSEAVGPPSPAAGHTTTVFDPRRYKRDSRGGRQAMNLLETHSAVRAGEYLVSPFVSDVGGPAGAGQVRSTAASQVVVPKLDQRVFQSHEPIFVSLPAGAKRANGERFMTFTLGPVLPGHGQVVLPTGIVQLEGDAGTGDARAVIVKRFRTVVSGQGVIPVDTLAVRPDQFPSAVEFGTATSVAYLVDRPVIAQIGNYLVLSSSAKDGFVTGDQVTLYAALGQGVAGETRAAEAAAVVQVMRVTPFGASAIILRRAQADISVGMPGRITAKMP